MRLDRLLSNMKFGSRKDVQKLIAAGAVSINGTITFDHARKLNPSRDQITVDGEEIYYKDEIILAMYKPIGYLSANSDSLHPVVMDLLKPPYHRHNFKIAGRLDLDAEGLLILTTSGNTIHLITNPNQKVIKTYEVTVSEPINLKLLNRLLEPITLLDGNSNHYITKALDIAQINEYTAQISLDSGKFHQVKRMFKAIGYDVVNLKRLQIGKYVLPNIRPGEYIEVSKDDIL